MTSKFIALCESKLSELTPTEAFDEFLTKRKAGAAKIAKSAKEKGGYSKLTAIHFAAKAKPYAQCESIEKRNEKDHTKANALYKEKAKEVYSKLKNLDSLSQSEFQKLMGELEVWGEVYIRAIKPDSIKL